MKNDLNGSRADKTHAKSFLIQLSFKHLNDSRIFFYVISLKKKKCKRKRKIHELAVFHSLSQEVAKCDKNH